MNEDETILDKKNTIDKVDGRHYPIIISILIFVFVYSTLSLFMIFDGWLFGFKFIRGFVFSDLSLMLPPHVEAIIYTMLGALIGEASAAIFTIHKYSVHKKAFDPDHAISYFYGPVLAILLSVIIYLLLQTGLFLLGPQGTKPEKEELQTIGTFTYLVIGVLTGFGWLSAVKKINTIVNVFFENKTEEKKTEQGAAPNSHSPGA
jgi:uncharacterized protein YacL